MINWFPVLLVALCGAPPTDADGGDFLVFGRVGKRPIVARCSPGGTPVLTECGKLPKSRWTPSPAFRDVAPEYVRHQIPDPTGERRYRVLLCRVDPSSGKLSTILEAAHFVPLGGTPKTLVIRTKEGIRRIDRRSGTIRPAEAAFDRIAGFGGVWLVRPQEAGDGLVYLYDVDVGRVTTPIRLPELPPGRGPTAPGSCMALHPKRTHLVCLEPVGLNAVQFGEARLVSSALHIIDVSDGGTKRIPIQVAARSGSGQPVLYDHFDLWFEPNGELSCFAAMRNPNRESPPNIAFQRLTIEPATGDVTRRPALRETIERHLRRPRAPRFIPPYFARLPQPPKTRPELLAAFLERHGKSHRIRVMHGERAVYRYVPHAFTSGGRRFLLTTPTGEGDVVYYGDLARDTLTPIDTDIDVHRIVWAPTLE